MSLRAQNILSSFHICSCSASGMAAVKWGVVDAVFEKENCSIFRLVCLTRNRDSHLPRAPPLLPAPFTRSLTRPACPRSAPAPSAQHQVPPHAPWTQNCDLAANQALSGGSGGVPPRLKEKKFFGPGSLTDWSAGTTCRGRADTTMPDPGGPDKARSVYISCCRPADIFCWPSCLARPIGPLDYPPRGPF